LVAAVFYVERSKALFDAMRNVAYSMMDIGEASDKLNYDFKVVKSMAWSISKKDFAKFASILVVSAGLGLATILFSIHAISGIPDGGLPLTDADVEPVNQAILLFAVFFVVAILTVISWLVSGFMMGTLLTAQYESLEHSFRLLSEFEKRLEPRVRETFHGIVKANEEQQGRKLTAEEMSALMKSADDRDSELAKQLSAAIQDEKKKILAVAGRAPRRTKP